jgi:hypothetical protein
LSIFTKGNWENRNVQYPKRRRLTEVEGQPNIYDVDREEGTIVSEGSAFSAENMNGLENRIETAFDSIETKINTARAGVELYSSGGTRGTITLSDNVSNYDYLEIYWKENATASFFCSKVTPTFKPKWSLCEHHYSSADGYYVFNSRFINITKTTITQSNVGYANVKTNTYPNVRTEDNLYILKVKGYKNNI